VSLVEPVDVTRVHGIGISVNGSNELKQAWRSIWCHLVTVSREGSSILHVLVRVGPPPGDRTGSRISRPSRVGKSVGVASPRRATSRSTLRGGPVPRAGPRTHCRIDASPGRERDGSVSVTRAPYAVSNRLAALALLVSLYRTTGSSRLSLVLSFTDRAGS
jgi:hypothetical protein